MSTLQSPPPSSSVARTRACLDAIDRHDAELRAFITVAADMALAQAEAADRAASNGQSLGLLHGLPIAIKDCIDVAGLRCTNGSQYFADNRPERDAPVIARLKSQGAVLIGKTNLHELCYGGTTQNETFGRCRNPWNTACIPGGSSGGSAVAVASGMCEAAIGSDTGVSIRVPAALCGIAGLRPTSGAIPNRGVLAVSPPHDTVGPMARTVTDIARLFAVMAGYDRDDPSSTPIPSPDVLSSLENGVEGLRILVPLTFFFDDVDPAVSTAVWDAARMLEKLGAVLIDDTIKGADRAQQHLNPIIYADAAEAHRDKLQKAPEKIGRQVRLRLQPGLDMDAVMYASCLRWLEGWRHHVSRLFAEHADIVLTPTVGATAPEITDDDDIIAATAAISRLGWAWPAAGVPALTLPCGFAPNGLPIGLQLATARHREDLLLRAGCAYQQATDWHARAPRLASRR